ncbi:cuticle protein CP14.6-like [Vanessa tameamea]|uniref:Cuticle protein CP14.6-like n=1 Tax=Vanessa tameamea TaxID=334116 RepID=A0A8B8I5G5_VANTA|nr:cuticle protein CP14.6-like [Vanessa tameamea]
MKSFVAILALVAVAAADVSLLTKDAAAEIVQQDADVFPDQYQYSFQTSNGISAQESGIVKNPGREDEALEVQGSNSYTGNDGQVYALKYVANENGYQPEGSHLPVAHPIPDYILRAIEYNAAHAKVEATRN